MSGLLGQKVKVWFDPGNPETAVVVDLKDEKFIPVARVPNAPAHARTPEEWQMVSVASAPHRAHMKQLRRRQSDLKATYIRHLRDRRRCPGAGESASAE